MKSFAELAALRARLREQGQAREQERRQAREAEQRRQREASVFHDAVAGVRPIKPTGRVSAGLPPVLPRALQHEQDEQAALQSSLSDDIDVEMLLETDAALSYRRPGIGQDVVRRLRRGEWVVKEQIDLHGLRVDEAREAFDAFLAAALRREVRCVRVIHGKGLGSPNREPVLKGKVHKWLVQRDEVLAFCQARPNDGGGGAVIVLLRAASAG